MVDAVMAPVNNANCEEDVDIFLISQSNERKTSSSSSIITSSYCKYRSSLAASPLPIKKMINYGDSVIGSAVDLDQQELNIVAYISGYIVH